MFDTSQLPARGAPRAQLGSSHGPAGGKLVLESATVALMLLIGGRAHFRRMGEPSAGEI